MSLPRPPLDPDLNAAHAKFRGPGLVPAENLAKRRTGSVLTWSILSKGVEDKISHTEVEIPGPVSPITASILRSKKPEHGSQSANERIGILHFHGGGHCMANRFHGLNVLFDAIEKLNAVVISTEYRLTPENPQPAQVEDCYAAFQWVSEHASEPQLGFNPAKLVICGGSAGGNLTAGVTLLARDRSGPPILGQLLFYPWLDDTNASVSLTQYGDIKPWTQEDNAHALDFALGKNRENASIYTVPARATDLSGLPPTYIDVGEADVFREEDVRFAMTLWNSGVSTELHVWPGAWHGFDTFAIEAEVSQRAIRARLEWLQRLVR
ncbi:alpha/beta hydrolase [Aspergillus lucknowensis]|uniref:Alpha/Beta hydrolase protein n=1 Tax=Aspergillus lucknowensis TaxID=176173 RepID=A0ABR4LHV1_9EURO